MSKSLSNILNFFRIPINLIRLEIVFASFFCFFFSLFIENITDLEFRLRFGVIASIVFLIIGIISFYPKFNQKQVRSISNLVFLLGFSFIFYVVYINKFSIEAFYLILINAGLYNFSLSSVKISISLNITLWLLTFFIIYLLGFQTEVDISFIYLAYLILSLASIAMAASRSNYKKKNKERSQYLKIVFNNSSNAQLLLKGAEYLFIDANEKARELLQLNENNTDEKFSIRNLKISNESLFESIKNSENKTIELADNRLIKIETKKVADGKDIFHLIEIEEFKDRVALNEKLQFEKLKTINEQSYNSLFKDNPSLITIISKDGKILDINDTYLKFLQYSKNEIVGRKHSILDFRDYRKEKKKVRDKAWQGETQLFEKEIVSKNGTVLFIEVFVRKAKYFGEDVLICNGRDISERKKLEKIADYNHLQYSTLFKESPIGLFISDLDGNIIETNESFQNLLQYKKEEFIGRNISFFSAYQQNAREIEKWEKLKNGEDQFIELEKVCKNKLGKEIHTLFKVNIQKDEENIPSKFLGQVIDINNFIQAKETLQLALKSYKDIFNTSFELRYILNRKNEFIDVNKAVENEYGYSRNEIIGKLPVFLGELDKMDFLSIQKQIEQAWAGEDQNILWWSKRKDGTVFPKRLHIRKGIYFGQNVLLCSGQNIQEYHEYEQEIIKREKKYKNLINTTIFGILIVKNQKIVFANNRALDILKYNSLSEIMNAEHSRIIKSNQENWYKTRETDVMAGKEIPLLELEMIDSNGTTVFVESIPTTIHFEGDECVLESFVEISDRKKAEAAKQEAILQKVSNDSLRIQLEQNRIIQRRLQNSQSYSEAIIESSLDMIFTTDTKGRINKLNSSAMNELQYDKFSFTKLSFGDLFNDPQLEGEIIKKLNIYNSFSGNFEMKRKDGSVFPALISISQLFNTDNTFLGIMGTSRDITEIVSKEHEIKEQASKLKAIIESSSHYFFSINRNYRLTSFNKLFREEVKKNYNLDLELFDSFFKIVEASKQENDVDNDFWKNIFNQAFNGESVEFEIGRKNFEGSYYYRGMYVNPIISENGNIEEISGIAHDITQKKLYEQELTNSLKEKEILLKEVHHRVKNNLQVISSILSLQGAYLTDGYALEVLRNSKNRIAAMASIHERLYRTTNLSDIRFSSYVKDLVESLVNTYELPDIDVELVFSLDEVFLSLNHAIPCGLILNELISNSLKYAFQGRKNGKIEVRLKNEDEHISISVADDGIGIPSKISVENTDTLGLQLVSTLVEQIEGELSLDRENGTKFTFRFDIKQEYEN